MAIKSCSIGKYIWEQNQDILVLNATWQCKPSETTAKAINIKIEKIECYTDHHTIATK